MYETKDQRYINVPNDPVLIRIFFSIPAVKVGKGLLKAVKEVKENPEKYQDIPGPYLSMIARYAGLNKRSTGSVLDRMEKEKIVKSKHTPYKIRGRPEFVKSYELLVDIGFLEWLEQIDVK